MSASLSKIPAVWLIGLAAFLLYVQALNVQGVSFRDDEVFYVRSTQEMRESGEVFSPTFFGEDRFQKPILFYWLVLAAYQLFGTSWFAARIVAVISASLTVALSWVMARDLFDRRVATLSSVILMTSPLFFRHAKAAVPDMTLNFFIVLAMFSAMRFFQGRQRRKMLSAFYLACALGFLTKGFAALIVPFATVMAYALISGNRDRLKEMRWTWGGLLTAAVVLPWFVHMTWVHGPSFTGHVLVTETQARLIAPDARNPAMKVLSALGNNSRFYLKVLANYFAPWSLFFALALPLGVRQCAGGGERKASLLWLVSWLAVVFVFFSLIFVTISHYLLVLATPLAILVSYFFVNAVPRSPVLERTVRSLLAVIMGALMLVLTLVQVFLIGESSVWVLVFALVLVGGGVVLFRHRDAALAPFLTGLAMVFILAQGHLLSLAGLTSFPALERLAGVVNRDLAPQDIITVGSHDLHENEWQLFFDHQVDKAGHSHKPCERLQLRQAFASEHRVYCLITEQDFRTYEEDFEEYHFHQVAAESLMRKRFRIDRGFFQALLKLDRSGVQDYLKENVLLLKKEAPALTGPATSS